MEHLILLIGLFLNGPDTDIKVLDKFTNPADCEEIRENLQQNDPDPRYKYFCRPVEFTIT